MAKKSKEARVQVILECTEHKASGMPGTSRYITTKNRKNTPDRLERRKYNPILKRVTVHREIKQLEQEMAKKAVASLQKGEGRTKTKCIKMERSAKTGAFVFKEEMVENSEVKNFFSNKK